MLNASYIIKNLHRTEHKVTKEIPTSYQRQGTMYFVVTLQIMLDF